MDWHLGRVDKISQLIPGAQVRSGWQWSLFHGFSLEEHVPEDHLLRSIDRFVERVSMRQHLEPCYGTIGRPSIDSELVIRMLLIGYCCGTRSERRLCQAVHFNLAYRWFCRLELTHAVAARARGGGVASPRLVAAPNPH